LLYFRCLTDFCPSNSYRTLKYVCCVDPRRHWLN